MAGYLQFQYGCSQDEDDLIGSENYFEPSRQFPGCAFRSYVQHPSPLARNLREEFEGGREVEEENDVEIVERPIETVSKKRGPEAKKRGPIAKKKVPAKKRATKVKVEGEEGEEEEKKKNWLDSEVEHLISMRGEMHSEFEKNAKKQGKLQIFVNFFFLIS